MKFSNGKSFDGTKQVSALTGSPLFQNAPFISGTTQYGDAVARAEFWNKVNKKSPNYHTLLGTPTIANTVTMNIPASQGATATDPSTGKTIGLVNINYLDPQIQSLINSMKFTNNMFPIFLSYDVYSTAGSPVLGNCCIGGYHSAEGSVSAPQAYAHATYVDHAGAFAQDVSALSHEIGEWADDPLVVNSGNNTPCGILENGDPLENDANFGDFAYKGTNGFTYNLQDLVTLPYFGAPPSTSVNGEFTFHGEGLTVCENGS